MKKIIIGHRGVGKTTFLKRHQVYHADILHFDLDREIEIAESKSVAEIFMNLGEAQFRIIEKRVYEKLIQNQKFVISVGAGFDSRQVPTGIEVIYLSRRTDSDGRFFLNRPRLNKELSPRKEYDLRYRQREPLFRGRADFIYHMPEGLVGVDNIEQQVFKGSPKLTNAFVMLTPESFKILNLFPQIELRTDIFSDSQIQKIISEYTNKFLISYRKPTTEFNFINGLIDWSLELGDIPQALINSELIVSNHEDSIATAIEKFEEMRQFNQKLCPVVNSWSELLMGYEWQLKDPMKRSFLPRTARAEKKSRWRWFRELQFDKQNINFIQGHQNFDDQPSLYEYLKTQSKKDSSKGAFAAVLGDPIHHSKTPVTQSKNFDLNVVAIPVAEEDFDNAISVLQKMGLCAAAITSPLKTKAGQFSQKPHSLNSLVFKNNIWTGLSTDEFGLQALIEKVPDYINKKCVVWGGGGVLETIRKIIPQALLYSAQTQKIRGNDEDGSDVNPEVLIWAAPRKEGVQWPNASWKPNYVLDLNYTENSMGIEFAQKTDAQYISGQVMFEKQAEKQLQFWKESLKN